MSKLEPSSVLSPRLFQPGQTINDPQNIIKVINDHEVDNYKLGAILIVCSIATWITGLEMVSVVLKGDDYTKPWFFTIIVGSCFSLNLLPDLFKTRKKSHDDGLIEPDLLSELSKNEIILLAFQLSILYFLYNFCVLQSLQYTSASNQTVIGTTSSIFLLFIGVIFKFDRFSIKKLICVIGSLLGVLFINYETRNEPTKNPPLGNCIAMVGAVMYALYLALMKLKCGMGIKSTNERQLFGFVGLITLLFGPPLLYVVDFLEIEKFEFPPPNNSILFAIIINGVFSVISDYTAILAMLLTSPLVVSLSLTTAIPITIFIDYIAVYFKTHETQLLSNIYCLGILCMLASVILINVNISTENELIEDVIENALEEAIKYDEILSPILSPIIESVNSPRVRAHLQKQLPFKLGVNHTLSPFFTPKYKKSPLSRTVSNFVLNENSLLQNDNHSTLYTVGGENESEHTLLKPSKSNITVYPNGNHKYKVKMDG